MVVSRPTTPELTKELNIPKDVASAMRKSLSYDFLNVNNSNEQASPIGTPRVDTSMSCTTGTGVSNVRVRGPLSVMSSDNASNDVSPDYQLWNHHITNASPSVSTTTTYNNVLEILQDWDFSGNSSGNHKDVQRRGSIEDVLKVRHWLNPRSSFSAASVNEPELYPPMSDKSSSANLSLSSIPAAERRCWVTFISDMSDLKPIITLHQSLIASQSKYKLLVLYSLENHGITEYLQPYNISCLGIHPLKPIVPNELSANITYTREWSVLSMWNELYDKFDLLVYLSPYSVVLSNVDELLDLSDEIDNETCVLIINGTKVPSLMSFKPHTEVAMVLEEFVTIYGQDWDKLAKLNSMDDWSILDTLFASSTSKIGEQYGLDVRKIDLKEPQKVKVLDFNESKPWLKNSDDLNDYDKLWWEVWDKLDT
ncbi:Ids2p Ecym_5188 [Eremothecium cymbalariae DBVPG|uniref:Uncharacterized protein n=1 Tax=Eremothecium cymbalariae (strain CBS 270.75 / DBVPG 7215 / KCTC 17166 / NRRL Y-17582) TaxID=931890 RepID=I6ND18_ERECY|nr:hypothetical protein Ecym_5188 [Eremothecium cymbalariae DBVPG\